MSSTWYDYQFSKYACVVQFFKTPHRLFLLLWCMKIEGNDDKSYDIQQWRPWYYLNISSVSKNRLLTDLKISQEYPGIKTHTWCCTVWEQLCFAHVKKDNTQTNYEPTCTNEMHTQAILIWTNGMKRKWQK